MPGPFFTNFMALVVLPSILALLLFTILYQTYLKMKFPTAAVVVLGAALTGGWWLVFTKGAPLNNSPIFTPADRFDRDRIEPLLAAAAFMIAFMCATAILAKIYRAWILDLASEPERQLGIRGIRAWLNPANLVMAAVVLAGTYIGAGWPVWSTAIAMLGLLLAYPAVNSAMYGGTAGNAHDEQDIGDERRRVLALVEAGKISAEDAAELIAALGQSQAVVREERGNLSGNRRVMLLGAALLLIGFCLPWVSVNVVEEIRTVTGGQNGQSLSLPMGLQQEGSSAGIALWPGQQKISVTSNTPGQLPIASNLTVVVRGGDLSYGVGWIILIAGMGVGVLTLVWPTQAGNRQSQRTASLVGLGAGTVVLVYVALGVFTAGVATHTGIGLMLAMLAYGVIWVGTVREYVRGEWMGRRVPALG